VTDNTLEALLDELRSTISDSETLGDDDRAKLGKLADRIEGQADDEEPGLVEHIGESVSMFETDHPSLVQTLNRIAQTLNAAGI
jgi:hypothetical protein